MLNPELLGLALHGYFLLSKHSILQGGRRFIRVKKLEKFPRLMKQEIPKAARGTAEAVSGFW